MEKQASDSLECCKQSLMDHSSGSSTDQHAYRNDRNVDKKDCSGGFKLQQGPIGSCIICITPWQRNSPDFVYALGFYWKQVFLKKKRKKLCAYYYYYYYLSLSVCILDM